MHRHGLIESFSVAGLDALDGPREPSEATAADPEPEATPAHKAPTARANNKQATVIALLRRPEGATLEQLVEATGWQNHSVRGAISNLQRKHGLKLTVETTDAGRVYRAAALGGERRPSPA